MATTANTTMNINDVMIGFKITSYNLTRRLCNLTVTCNGRSENFKKVRLSHLLCWKLENKPEYYNTDRVYESTMTSDDYKANPLQLIKAKDKTTGELYHLLAGVEERTPLKLKYYDPFGQPMTKYINRYHKKDYYLRYRNYAKLND